MLELKPHFRQLHRNGAYPRLEDLGLIGDGTTAALVSLDGSIPWLCLPRFVSEAVFGGLLDVANGGRFVLAPEEIVEARQYYEPDTAVLYTEFQAATGCVRVTDAMAVRGRLDGAAPLHASLCGRASPLGLLPEQIDPSTGGFIGNFHQAFSHIGVIASGVTLERAGAHA